MKAEQRAHYEKLLTDHGWIEGVTWYHPKCRGAIAKESPPRAWTFEEAIAIDRFGCWSRDIAETEVLERIQKYHDDEAAKPRILLPDQS